MVTESEKQLIRTNAARDVNADIEYSTNPKDPSRRKFLKYAIVGGVVAGAYTAADAYFQWTPYGRFVRSLFTSKRPPTPGNQTTTIITSPTTIIPPTTTEKLASLKGRLFFDYNGNGIQDGEEPAVSDAKVQLKDDTGKVIADVVTDSSGDYKLEDIRAGSYGLYVEADKKFRYMCQSPEKFRAVTEGYDILLNGPRKMDVGLMEGFLTLPILSKTRFSIGRFYDWDPSELTYLWWNGKKGFVSEIGGDANHSGVDYDIPEGEDVVALAPGVVSYFEKGPQGQLGLTITHPTGNLSVYYSHLSRYVVEKGQEVARGQKVAESGMTGAVYPHLHINNYRLIGNLQQLYDFYKPIFPLSESLNGYWERTLPDVNFYWKVLKEGENPNGQGFWTVCDNPKFFI